MTLLQHVTRCMEKIAPLKLAESAWDNVGVLVEAPFPRPNATRVFLTIDLRQHVLEEALKDPKIGVIVAYHPPIFKAVKRLCMNDDKQSIALKCAASGVSIFSPHTALDNCVSGINDWLARGLGIGQTTVINAIKDPPADQLGSGSGRIHLLEKPVDIHEMVRRVKSHLKLAHVRLATPTQNKQISSIAICAGSGASVLMNTKADLYLTGEMSHHEVLAALADDISVILCEHTNTERGYLAEVLQPRLQALLRENEPGIEVVVSSIDRDPLVVV
ncbi:hypothetical protein SpCBS45565_g03494 [Spizellomyces sp. 'palustris']|nr:hypothetical protein SpCBS45565_g03494 [Spizellomyces sp. 'palustris']